MCAKQVLLVRTAIATHRAALRRVRNLAPIVLVIAWLEVPPAYAGDLQTWHTSTLRWGAMERTHLVTEVQARVTDDVSDLSDYRFGHGLEYRVRDDLRAGGAYRYIRTEDSAGDWRHTHRLELYLTQRWRLAEPWSLALRNRLEVLRDQGERDTRQRTRHRVTFDRALSGRGALERLSFGNEVFYDFESDRVSENRLVPVALGFRLLETVDAQVGWMMRSTRRNSGWEHDQVITTSLAFRL
jgi:hypothetical protein